MHPLTHSPTERLFRCGPGVESGVAHTASYLQAKPRPAGMNLKPESRGGLGYLEIGLLVRFAGCSKVVLYRSVFESKVKGRNWPI